MGCGDTSDRDLHREPVNCASPERCATLSLDKRAFLWYIITMRSEKEKKEEQRKAENRVKRWNESVKKVQEMIKNWKKVNR
jgi:hypothetical protein